MDTYTMKQRVLPMDASWDVIVVGGGPSGCTAAAAASREGARTLLIEETGCLGGMGTMGLVPNWAPFSDKEKIIYKGLAERVFNAVKAGMPHVDSHAMDWVPKDPELLKRIYDELMTEMGVSVLFNTVLSSVEMKSKNEIEAIAVSNKSGLTVYKAKVYVDCTGDGDLAAWAGAEFEKGDRTGELQPATHCFILSNVDEYGYRYGEYSKEGFQGKLMQKIVSSGKFELIQGSLFSPFHIGPGTVGFNAGHIWEVDNTEPLSVSKSLMQGRKIADSFKNALAMYNPKAFGNSFLVATGPLMGIRETRRIIGDYVLDIEDYIERRSFDDEICRNSYFIDVHYSMKESCNSGHIPSSWESRYAKYEKGESYGIPYRCLTPKGIKNVLVAGRSISCDREVQGSIRVMPVCLATGEAAGMAAAHAHQMTDVDVHNIDTGKLRKRLKEEGVYLP